MMSLLGRLSIVVAIGCLLLSGQVASAGGGGIEPAAYGYFDFPTCVRYALVHSDALMRSRVQIQLKSLDLKDAHAEIVPDLELQVQYYLILPPSNPETGEYNYNRTCVNVVMSNFNPMAALLKIKGMGVLVDLAKIAHFGKMAEVVGDMAKTFYKIDVLKKQIRLRKQMLALRRNKVGYGKSRLEQGAVDEVQVKLWTNSASATQVSLKTLEADLQTQTLRLKALMGYHPDYCLPLDTRNAADQVLGGFNGQMVAFSDLQASNFHLRLAAKKEQLQSVKTEGSYAAILPKPTILFQSASGLANVASGLYLAFGFNHTLWDGFRKIRDIKRQKMEMRSLNLERHELSKDLYQKYRQVMALLDISGERESLEQEQAKLAEQNEERVAMRYKSGVVPFEEYMDARIEKADTDINAIRSYNDRVEALIDLATLAGGLNRYNGRIRF